MENVAFVAKFLQSPCVKELEVGGGGGGGEGGGAQGGGAQRAGSQS